MRIIIHLSLIGKIFGTKSFLLIILTRTFNKFFALLVQAKKICSFNKVKSTKYVKHAADYTHNYKEPPTLVIRIRGVPFQVI